MSTVQVRDAAAPDAEAIAGLVNRAFLVERFFVDGDRTNPAEISRLLSVDPSRQGEGLGRLLVDAAEDRCRSRGCRMMEIHVVDLREELPPFYHRLGYVEAGTEPFPDTERTRVPARFIVMTKPLG